MPVAVLLVSVAVLGSLFRGAGAPYGLAAVQVLQAGIAVAVFVAWARRVDRRPAAAYGLAVDRRWMGDLAAGALVGAAPVAGAVASGVVLGWMRVTDVAVAAGGAFLPGIAAFAVAFAGVAVWEELAFRALALTNAAEGFRRWFDDRTAVLAAWAATSLLFGVLHANQAPTPSAVAVWVVAGSVPGLAYVLSGRLGYAVGFHFAVDAAVNPVFNLGGADVPALVGLAQTGPEAMVGATGALTAGWLLLALPLTVAWAARGDGGLSVVSRIGGR